MNTDFIDIVPAKEPQPWSWTLINQLRATDVADIMNAMEDYWPVGVRSVYYQVISMPGFKDAWHWRSQKGKTKGQPLKNYVDTIGELLKWCRLQQYYDDPDFMRGPGLPMSSINDDGRQVGGKVGFSSNSQFFHQQMDELFNGHTACLAQNQERHIEVWVEKQGLFHIADRASQRFCRRTLAVRGYPSVTCLNDYAERVVNEDDPLILYFGDMDVDGMEIPRTFMRSLHDEHDVYVEVVRCGLNPDQVSELRADPVGIKGSKQQKRDFIRECGDKAYELDAVPPAELERLVYDTLEDHTDMEIFEADKKAGKATSKGFDTLQDDVEDYAEERAIELGLLA